MTYMNKPKYGISIKADKALVDRLKKLRQQNKIGTIKHFVDQAIIEKLKNEKL